MSTAWYRSNVIPKCVKRFDIPIPRIGAMSFMSKNRDMDKTSLSTLNTLTVEIWDTTCVVTNFNTSSSFLINPANPRLCGVSNFPYFPKGGPEPAELPAKDAHPIMGYTSQWGGMEVGQGMMFSANVVDGLVHQMGGKELKEALSRYSSTSNNRPDIACPEGRSVWTPATGDLKTSFPAGIIHTVPPFYKSEEEEEDDDDESGDSNIIYHTLKECYHSSIQLIIEKVVADTIQNEGANNTDKYGYISQSRTRILDGPTPIRVACPLLGAGCRGFPVDTAIQLAAEAFREISDTSLDNGMSTDTSFSEDDDNNDNDDCNGLALSVAFAIPSEDIRSKVIDAFHRQNFESLQ